MDNITNEVNNENIQYHSIINTEVVIPEDVISEDVISEDVIPEVVIPEDVISEDVIPEIVIPEDVIPEDVIPEKIKEFEINNNKSNVVNFFFKKYIISDIFCCYGSYIKL